MKIHQFKNLSTRWITIALCHLTFFVTFGVTNESSSSGGSPLSSVGNTVSSFSSYDANINFKSPKHMPQILSHDQLLRAKQGHSIVLPCQVANLDSFVLMWKQANRVLTAGNLVVRKDPRMSLRDDYSLELSHVTPDDQGVYTCEIDIMGKTISIKHTLEVLVPPAVQATPRVGKVTVRKGKDFTLRCAAKGNPNPTISWSKENGVLPSGQLTEEGLSLELRQVQRDDAGVYVCTATNGVGPAAKSRIEVEIKYPPEIEIEQNWFQPSGEKFVDVELLCNAHANPDAEISWYRQQKKLHENDRQLFQAKAGSLRLSIRNVRPDDFGNYSCKAENNLGKARAYISISGRPRPPRFTSEAIGHKPHSYNVTWTTDSISPVTEFKLFYRPSDGMPLSQTDNFQELTGTWEKVFIPVLDPTPSFTTKASYTLKHIQPGAVYEILASAKNIHGWSDYSKVFNFFNKGVDYSTQQLSAVSDQQLQGEDDSLERGQSSNLRSDSKDSRKFSTSVLSSTAAWQQHPLQMMTSALMFMCQFLCFFWM